MKLVKNFLIALALCTTSLKAAEEIGTVNFAQCLSDSKAGKNEQASFEALQKQMKALLEDTEKQLNEIAAKLSNPEFMDGLSREGEDELKAKFQALSEEMNRHQSQYYQVLNQANMKVVHSVGGLIQQASEEVAKELKLKMVLNKEACFFSSPVFDVTKHVIDKMDKKFAQEASKKQNVAQNTPQNSSKPENKK